jgi:hypothetical protein
MTITATPGNIRFRKHQVGIQTLLGTAVPATYVEPYRGPITFNPNTTDPDVDVGSLDPILAPFRTVQDVACTKTGPLAFNPLAIRLQAGLKGGVSPTGAGSAKTWTYQVASLTADVFDVFTDEWGDDTSDVATTPNSDGILAFGGLINVLEETMPEDLSPWTISDQWIYAGATFGNRTPALTVDQSPTWVFGADTKFYMDTTAGTIGGTALTNTVHGATIRVSNNLDPKRYANGNSTRFNLTGYGRGPRQIELVLTVAKTAAMIAERATLDDATVPDRFFAVTTTSLVAAQAGIQYSYDRRGAFRLFSVDDGEQASNSTMTLTYRAYYDATLTYAYRASCVNTLTAMP